MKQFIRSVTLLALIGGWGLASAAVYVVRTPTKILIIPKDTLGYKDTYVDTRAWTLSDDRAHPAVVERIIHLGKGDALSHTVNTGGGSVETQLASAVGQTDATAAHDSANLADKAKSEIKSISDGVKSKLN